MIENEHELTEQMNEIDIIKKFTDAKRKKIHFQSFLCIRLCM